MRYLCSECGSEIADDAEFCYACGSLKSKAVRIPDVSDVTGDFVGVCTSCGENIRPGEIRCNKCGTSITAPQVILVRPKLTSWGIIGILLAIIPGSLIFFGIPAIPSIFGLGHLAFKRWSRGLMFLGVSLFLGYLRFTMDQDGAVSYGMIFILTLFVFFLQTTEALALAILPKKTD
jgi:DNA-directed RNA polymerase subunit RPC12/RpoP